MKLKCLAIDDELPALNKLKSYIGRLPYLELVDSCDNALDARNILAQRDDIDAIFADINMPDLNGLDFLAGLGPNRPDAVFITAYPDYAIESFRAGAVDYLLKPYSFEDFCRAAGRLVERKNISTGQSSDSKGVNGSFFVKVDTRWVKLYTDQIEFIRGYGDYLRIYVTDRPNPIVTYSTLSAMLEMLPDDFIQVHRSYIVNMATGVTTVERARIMSVSGNEIPIGDSYRDNLGEYLMKHTIVRDTKR